MNKVKTKKNAKSKKGFTLVEVALFLAISGFLVTALITGTNFSISRQRYNDSTQDFVTFLNKVYSEVIHVENQQRGSGGGNSQEYAIYGKLIDFASNGEIKVYSVIGDADSSSIGNTDVITALRSLNASIAHTGMSNVYKYSPTYDAIIEDAGGNRFAGRVLIVRSPVSGTVRTYFSSDEETCDETSNPDSQTGCWVAQTNTGDPKDVYSNDGYVDFCIRSDDNFVYGGRRRNIRLDLKNGFNASAVKLIDFDEDSSECE